MFARWQARLVRAPAMGGSFIRCRQGAWESRRRLSRRRQSWQRQRSRPRGGAACRLYLSSWGRRQGFCKCGRLGQTLRARMAADWVLTTSRVRGSLPLPRRRSRAAARSRHGGGNREARFQTLRPQNAGGFSALNGALCAANEGGWRIARLALRNSGETSGDYGRVVGVVCYGAWALSATSAS